MESKGNYMVLPSPVKKFVPNCSEELVVGGAFGSKGNCVVLPSPVEKNCPHMFKGLSLSLVIRKRSRNLLSVALPLHEGDRFGILMSSSW